METIGQSVYGTISIDAGQYQTILEISNVLKASVVIFGIVFAGFISYLLWVVMFRPILRGISNTFRI